MEINVTCETIENGVKLVKVSGSMNVNTSEQAQEDIFRFLEANDRIAIDLSACEYISSSGLRVLLLTAKRAKSLQAKVVYAAAIPEVKEVLEMTGFIKVLECADTLDEAVALLQ